MARYSELMKRLKYERNSLYSKIRDLRLRESNDKKIKSIISKFKEKELIDADYSKIEKLRSYFPENKDEFDLLKRIAKYRELVEKGDYKTINLEQFTSDLNYSCTHYNIPPRDMLDDIINQMKETIEIVSGKRKIEFSMNKAPFGGINQDKHSLKAYINSTCYTLAMQITKAIEELLDKEKREYNYEIEIPILEKRLELVEKFMYKFNDLSFLSSFSSDEELKEFVELIESLFDDEECIEILRAIKEEQEEKEKATSEITFSNLDLSQFTEEERLIIEELREIYEDEVIDGNDLFSGQEISYNSRLELYKNASINDILMDVKENLLNNIYENEEVIQIFKLIIDIYNKNELRIVRENIVKELLRIKSDFESIITYIHKTFKDPGKAFDESQKIKNHIISIDEEYLPLAEELCEKDLEYDDYYDSLLETMVTKYQNDIKKWKREMSLSYDNEVIEDTSREDTDNLVFCLTSDIELSDEGHQKEFVGTIGDLEMKTSHDLKKASGRKGMTRLRKSTGGGDEKDFVDYINGNILRSRASIHFVPYRYSYNPYYRTGLVKFEPSQVVKDFLEKKYGLSKQSAYYGVFQVIHSMRANHNEYSFFEDYILSNYQEIEEIAQLFASNDPDYDKLIDVIEKMLKIKKDILAKIEGKKY